MGARRGAALIVTITAMITIVGGALAGCTSDGGGAKPIKTADAYAAAIRWYLDSLPVPTPTTDGDEPGPVIVYVAPENGNAIDSQAQASVIADMADMQDEVTVRFADVRDDALESDDETQPVKDEGVLLLVGDVEEGPPPVEVSVSVYRNIATDHAYLMKIVRAGDSFRAASVTEVEQG